MDITPQFKTRTYLPSPKELADHWREWGYGDDQHHCVLVAFFETWKTLKESIGSGPYYCLARVLEDHYRQAVWPADGVFVYWLSGERRSPMHSYIHSRQEFDERYLSQFGPLFSVVGWLNEYRLDPRKAIEELQAKGRQKRRALGGEDGVRKARPVGRPRKGEEQAENVLKINSTLTRGSTAVTTRLARLKRDAPEFAGRYAVGEFTTVASAERASKGVSNTLVKLRKAWDMATPSDRETFMREIGSYENREGTE